MAFCKFNICSPCCQTCEVEYHAITCSNNWLSFGRLLPPYVMSTIPVSSVCSYIALCTGVDFNICSSYTGPISEIFYPLEDLTNTGIHTFSYPYSESSQYAIITSGNGVLSFNNRTNLPTAPNCTGYVVNHSLFLNDWTFGGYPCYWNSDYSLYNLSVNYQRNVDYTFYNEKNIRLYRCHNFGGSNIQACYFPTDPSLGYYEIITGNELNISYIINELKVLFLPGASVSTPVWISDLQLVTTYITYIPSGTNTSWCFGGGFPSTYDLAQVHFIYTIAGNFSSSCNISSLSIFQITNVFAGSSVYFTGPNALTAATNFINSLPPTISKNDPILPALLILDSLDDFSASNSDSNLISYSCPGFESIRLYKTLTNCGLTSITGYNYISITQ